MSEDLKTELTENEKRWLLLEAIKVARKVRRPVSRALLLLKISRSFAGSDEVASMLQDVREIAKKLDDPDHGILLTELGTCLALRGDVAGAEAAFAEVEALGAWRQDAVASHGLLFRLAEAYCDLKWYPKALELANRTTEEMHKVGILVALSRKYVEAGDLACACDVIRLIPNPSSRASELTCLIVRATNKRDISP